MSRKRPLVIVTRKLPDVIETRMMELFDTRLNDDDHPMSRDELVEAVKTADILVPTLTDRIDKGILAQAGENLRLIANFATGVDHIDLAAARERGITVTNTPGVLTEDTADMTMALILAVIRRVSEGDRLIRDGEWTGWGPNFMLGHRLWGKRLGIIGMGRIGSAVARRARGFGLSDPLSQPAPIAGSDRKTRWRPPIGKASTRCWRAWTSFQSTARTHRRPFICLSARRLKLLKGTAVVVNTSRGEVIDEQALTRILRDKAIAGAGLDVFEHEPAVNPKLLALNNVVLLPHMGSATIEGRIDMGEKVIINIKTFVDGHKPPDRVIDTLL